MPPSTAEPGTPTAGASLTPTSYVVLGLLDACGPSTPYQMEALVDASLGHFWSFPHSQLYSEPGRLAAAGLVEEEREDGGRRRRTFRITDAGRAALRAWLGTAEQVTSEVRDLGLLRLFFGASSTPADIRASARACADGHRAKLALYEELAAAGLEPHVAATLRLGIAYEQAAIAFWDDVAAGRVP